MGLYMCMCTATIHICVLQSYVMTSCAAEFLNDVMPLHADWSIFRVDINVHQYGKMLM